MNKDELFEIKQKLEEHIEYCNHILSSLHESAFTDEQEEKIKKISNIIKYSKSQVLLSMGEERKFIELIDSIPSVAVQGYNKKREVIYWNKASEEMYGYTSTEALGEKLEELIIPEKMREDVVSFITDWYEKGKVIPAGELLLQRKDGGTAHVFSSHIMLGERSSDPEMFCVDVDLSEVASLKEENQELENKANIDKLTGIYNRHYFESIIDEKMKRSRLGKGFLSLIMIDIDFFKKINDQYGHDVGDKALVELVRIVQEAIRSDDVFVRWGGEEFMVLIEKDLPQAEMIAHNIRKRVAKKTTETSEVPSFTCSFGVVDVSRFASFQKAYEAVDEKLYLAKNNGRNRVES
ncbi:MAG: diguanylate cyclase [Candidatus Electrothrix sp. GW3-4]|uniref:GGDEF domain-containing protein n=1 Tax=Candidatus Electrothrix sp. GW3-4 TaxID=3126740 RepID=UPI0030D0E5D0